MMKWVPIILSVTLKFNWVETSMDPPLRLWWVPTVNSGRVSDGGEILPFDYAEAIWVSLSSRAQASLCFTDRFWALKTLNVGGDLKAVCVLREAGLFCNTRGTIARFSSGLRLPVRWVVAITLWHSTEFQWSCTTTADTLISKLRNGTINNKKKAALELIKLFLDYLWTAW